MIFYYLAILSRKLVFLYYHRYEREFGFVIDDRDIHIDDIRVRGIGKTEVNMDNPIKVANGPAPVEMVV